MSSPFDPNQDKQVRVDEAIAEYLLALDRGDPLDCELWLEIHADIRQELVEFLDLEKELGLEDFGSVRQPVGDLELTTEFRHAIELRSSAADSQNHGAPEKIGSYRIIRLLGAGGMGRVFEAMDPLGNLVAVKLISPRCMRSPDSLQRFKQEGRIASSINHPRCVFVKAADEDQGQPYIVMELMTGKTLKDLSHESGPLTVPKAVNAIIDVLDGLEEAHSQGMIHRDIKPANCYLESNGRVKVGDFGLARTVVSDSELTKSGEFVGTPLFASPEQVKGHSIDARSDIYSVCATLYFLLTGKAPFAGTTPTSVIAKIVSEDPQPIRELNPNVPILLERIILKGLQRERKLRFQTIAELREALEPFVSGRQSFAAWGRRFAAYGLDSTLTGAFSVVATQLLSTDHSSSMLSFWMYSIVILPIALYYLTLEGIGNATLGKRLLKLHIVSQRTGERPSRWQLVMRTLIAIMLMGVLSDLLIYLFFFRSSSESPFFLHWIGYVITYSALFSSLLLNRRGRLLLHDWLSGTMVVDKATRSTEQQLAIRAANYQVPLLAATGFPNILGDFSVKGLVCSSDKYAVLLGYDDRLERSVWLHLRPREEAELNVSRRECARLTRLRWLTSGFHERWRWDAYLALQGAPLRHWSSPDFPLHWPSARGILQQLVEEFDSSARDGTKVNLESLDQLWMDSRGRIALVDWSPIDASQSRLDLSAFSMEGPSKSPDELDERESTLETPLTRSDCAVLCETARLALCGTSRPLDAAVSSVNAIVPLHAQELLQQWTDGRQPSQNQLSIPTVLNALRSSSQKSAEVKFENRALGLAFVLVPGLLMFGIVAAMSRLGNQLMLDKIADQLVAMEAADWMLRSDGELEYDKARAAVDNFPNREEMAQWALDRDSRRTRLGNEYRQRFVSLGLFSDSIAVANKFPKDPIEQLKAVTFEWQKKELVAAHWKHDDLSEPVNLTLLAKQIRAKGNIPTLQLMRRGPAVLFWIILSPFLVWVLWSGLSKGGVSMRVSGLCIVGADGKPARWHIALLRSILVGLPFLILQFLITWIDLFHPNQLWLSIVFHQILLWLFIVYAILTIAFTRQTPADWLLGTSLVPR